MRKRIVTILLAGTIIVTMLAGCGNQTADAPEADGGDCTVVNLPDEGITGNSHFMFQELNNDVIADHIAAWLESKGLN